MSAKVKHPINDNGHADSAVLPPVATSPSPLTKDAPLDDPALYFNRELSWLDFNRRVLAQAFDERVPLLERVRFLAYTATNLDEFFRKRVGGLKRQKMAGVRHLSPDGRTPQQQLKLIWTAARPFYKAMDDAWEQHLKPRLQADAGVHILDYTDLNASQQRVLHTYFREHLFPVLTPLAVDPGHPFPFISNLSLSLAVMLHHPKRGTQHFARIKVPTERGRWVPLASPFEVVPVEQVILHNLHELFRGMQVEGAYVFRVTRNVDLSRDEEEAEDLTAMIADELRERRVAPVVRLEVEHTMPKKVQKLLLQKLTLGKADLYEVQGLIDYTDCMNLADLDLPEHQYPAWEPVTPGRLRADDKTDDAPDLFDVIRQGDLLVHHPYESFQDTVQRFIEVAATDPTVLAIKQTLYRTSMDSPIIAALVRAAEAGKQVAVIIEVKARYDEQQNIELGQRLERSGVHVVYGLVGLKTHVKATLVIREEAGELRSYCHIGSGNYNPATAPGYTDVGLFTCDLDVGFDVANLFHYLTGYAPEQQYQTLIVAPRAMRQAFVDLIAKEVRHQEQHGNGRIIAQMNGLDDGAMIQELYRASQAGVQVDLIVRGHCRLRPGLPFYSETIRVISIIGRFLENSRLYYFHNNDDPQVFVGSTDWMRRNLDDRVEAVLPVNDAAQKERLVDLLHRTLADQCLAWDLHADGRYIQRQPSNEEETVGLHESLMHAVREA